MIDCYVTFSINDFYSQSKQLLYMLLNSFPREAINNIYSSSQGPNNKLTN